MSKDSITLTVLAFVTCYGEVRWNINPVRLMRLVSGHSEGTPWPQGAKLIRLNDPKGLLGDWVGEFAMVTVRGRRFIDDATVVTVKEPEKVYIS